MHDENGMNEDEEETRRWKLKKCKEKSCTTD
jgi:hypothetical protein